LNTLFAKETIQNIWGVVYDSTKPNDLGELTVVLYKENTYLYFYLALAIFSIALYLIGHKVFAKKDLPL
jgi:hypothetical protein